MRPQPLSRLKWLRMGCITLLEISTTPARVVAYLTGWYGGHQLKCYVCDQPAQLCEASHELKGVNCDRCGSYLVAIALLAERAINKLSFDVDRTRKWLADCRAAGDRLPTILSTNAYWRDSPWRPTELAETPAAVIAIEVAADAVV